MLKSLVYSLFLVPIVLTAGQMQVCRDQQGLLSFSDTGCEPGAKKIATLEQPKAQSVIGDTGLRPGETKMLQDLEDKAAERLEQQKQRALEEQLARAAEAREREVELLEDALEEQRQLNQRLNQSLGWNRYKRYPRWGVQHQPSPRHGRHHSLSGAIPDKEHAGRYATPHNKQNSGLIRNYPPSWWLYYRP